MKKIAVYSDRGSHPRGIRMLINSLRETGLAKKYRLTFINGNLIKNAAWEEETALLIFPGGRDIHYHEILRGPPNKRIISFVEGGGRYLGICAGGYYGTSFVEFEIGGPLEIMEQRELSFFPGKAVGSAYGPRQFRYNSESGARKAKINWLPSPGTFCHLYFNGGCFFANASAFDNVRVLATYSDLPKNPAAIVECAVKKGKAILSGIHPEYNLKRFASDIPDMQLEEKKRLHFFNDILERLLYG